VAVAAALFRFQKYEKPAFKNRKKLCGKGKLRRILPNFLLKKL
jgi:hypothetical protein